MFVFIYKSCVFHLQNYTCRQLMSTKVSFERSEKRICIYMIAYMINIILMYVENVNVCVEDHESKFLKISLKYFNWRQHDLIIKSCSIKRILVRFILQY